MLFNYCGLISKAFLTFLSRCLSSRVSASVSPPGHTAEVSPSVSKPTHANKAANERLHSLIRITAQDLRKQL